MFPVLGKLVVRFWPIVLAAWGAALALCWLLAPAWDTVADLSEVASLPADTPSRHADQLLQEAFPKNYAGSSIVLVAWRDASALNNADRKFIERVVAPRLRSLPATGPDGQPLVTRIRTLADQGSGALLVSRDKQATLIVMDLTPPFLDTRSLPLVAAVEEAIGRLHAEGAVPEGLELALTGSATAGRDLRRAQEQTVHAVEVWTIVVIVVLLLLLYRAPLVTLIPLVTVFFAVTIALRLLALLAAAGVLGLYRDIDVFITVLVYGAGVDYCVFLLARDREERDRGTLPKPAVAEAVGRVGLTITASAATVICGIGMLAFTRFSKIHEAGASIPAALGLVLVAALTLTPALLAASGRWAFWPPSLGVTNPAARPWLPNLWEMLGPILLRRPGTILLLTAAAMTPFVVLALWRYDEQNYNPISELPQDASSTVANRVVARHFSPGMLGPATVLVQNDAVDFGDQTGIDLVGQLTDRLASRADELALADVRSVAQPLGITPAAQEGLNSPLMSPDEAQTQLRLQAVDYYVSQAGAWQGHMTRIDLVLAADSLSRTALADLARIEATVRDELPPGLAGSQIAFSGATASTRDLATVKEQDERRMQILVPAVILVLLLVVLRRAAIALYLVLSVLFSYAATLGVTFLVFGLIQGAEFSGLDWKVPIFLFTILVAVGEDYNIFLVMRIREEQAAHGPLGGIPVALGRTGRVISSCGFIMAGTFACLLSGSLTSMQQLGFALAFGVLLDTLVVRPILVPCFLILLQGGTLGRVGRSVALVRQAQSAQAVLSERR